MAFLGNRKLLVKIFIGLSGLILLFIHAKISILSHKFIFGMGHSQRPIVSFLTYALAAFIVYLVCFELTERNIDIIAKDRSYIKWIIAVSVLCRLALVPSVPIQETDPYRYIWDGQTMIYNANPYMQSPAGAAQTGIIPDVYSTPERFDVFRKINHVEVKTIYPPGGQFLFLLSQKIFPWTLWGWKIMILIAECTILWIIILTLSRMKIPKELVLLYGWSPLAIKEFSNSLHIDVFSILFLCVMVYCLTRQWFLWSYVAYAGAVLIKLYPIVLLPVLVLWTFKKDKIKTIAGIAVFMLAHILFFLPFISAGRSVFEGLLVFSKYWKVNDSLFSIVYACVRTFFVSDPGLTGIISRIIVAAIFLVVLFFVMKWLLGKEDLLSLNKAALVLLASVFFLAPTGNPWYYLWIFPFIFFLRLRALIIFSGLVFLYYLDFYFSYRMKDHLFASVRIVEYSLFFVILGVELCWINRQSLSSFLSKTKRALLGTH